MPNCFHLTLDTYQNDAAKTAVYPGQGTSLGLLYCALKLAGEAGEVAENVGKALRDDELCYPIMCDGGLVYEFNQVTALRREALKKELGDALWYITMAARELRFTLAEVAEANLAKLADRERRGVLKGSGDDR